MKASEIRELSAAELESKLKDLKAELFNLRFQLAINQLDNPMRISAVKKDIARVKTVLRQMELNDSSKAYGKGGLSRERKKYEKNQCWQGGQQQNG